MYYDPVTRQWVNPVGLYPPMGATTSVSNPPATQQPSQRQTPIPIIMYALGDEEARAAQLQPGTTAYIFNAQKPIAYIKEVDAMGRPIRFEAYDLVPREDRPKEEPVHIDTSAFVTTEQLSSAMASVKEELSQTLSKEIEKALTDAFAAKVGKTSKSKGE